MNTEILQKAANQARGLAIDAIYDKASGHMGLPLGCAEIGAILYGELLNSRKLASVIVKARAVAPISTTGQLYETVKRLFGRDREKKEMAKLFQALRIEVNKEMDALKEMLQSATELLRPGGRLVVLTYHSLEDRLVKNLMKTGNVEGRVEQDLYGTRPSPYRMVGKVTVASREEQEQNSRSRSAKLRIGEKR